MALFPFEVKTSSLLSGPTGYANATPELRSLIDMVCEIMRTRGWGRPVITELGRYMEDQRDLYVPTLFARYRKRLTDHDAMEAAQKDALQKFSWHCLPVVNAQGLTVKPQVRAVDFRTNLGPKVVLDELQCVEIIRQIRGRFVGPLEALHHIVAGNAKHLHFALPDPLGKPQRWLSRADAEAMNA